MEILLACLQTIVRSVAAVLILQVLARINGAKQISQLSFYDYITGITIGSMTAALAIEDHVPFYYPLLSILVFILASYLEGRWTLCSLWARRWIGGMPVILMFEGQIIAKNLKKVHLTVNELLSEARASGYFDLSNISIAIMETSGKISFLPFAKDQPVTAKALGLHPQEQALFINVVIDGEILDEELHLLGHDVPWLMLKLQERGMKDPTQAFLVLANSKGEVHIYPKHVEASNHPTPFI